VTERDHVQVLGRRAQAWRSNPEASTKAVAELAERSQRGDTLATGELLRVHTPHVRGVCWRLRVRRSDVDDFVQEGLLAMLTPIARFDCGRGAPLWSYARPFVKGRLVEALGWQLGMTRHQSRHYRAVWRVHDALEAAGQDTGAESLRLVLRREGRRVSAETVSVVLEASGVRRSAGDRHHLATTGND